MRSNAFATTAGLALSLALFACSSGSTPGVVPEHPDFTGTWLLNADASQEPEDEAPGRPGGGQPPGREPGASRTRTEAGGDDSFLPSVAFRLEEDDSTLIFSDAQGRERRIFQDGREFREPVEGLGNLTVTAEWKGEKLVIKRQLESGATITETYELKEDGRQLHIKIKIYAMRTIEFVRVYDLADAY